MTPSRVDLTQRLAGKVAVITGGASGIGLAAARRMHAEGATIVVGDIDPKTGKPVADELGGTFVPVDVADEIAVDNLFDTAAKTYGSVDIAFNNAGISPPDDDLIENTELPAWQKVQDVPGMRDHREDKEQPLDAQYAPAHEVELVRGGYLHGLAGSDRVVVNSLHSQGVQTLGGNLEIEARAPDGLIEAFRVGNAPGFALAVQWHPEWQVLKNPFSHAMFAAFGDAARACINARK